jgi:ATP-dependent Clp protease adaptor protein ClpS
MKEQVQERVRTKERTQVELKAKTIPKQPPLYQVVMINDDYTSMDFVIEVLVKIFNMDTIKAQNLMLEIHHCGQGICGVYPREVAEMKVAEVLKMGQKKGHPLRCFFEPTT